MPDLSAQRLNLHTLPPELLNSVVDAIPERRDLLSLALVCSTLCEIIIPGQLQYRVLIASEEEVGLWACLAVRGHLARNVRSVQIFDRLEFERRTHWGEPVCPRLPSWTDTDRRGLAYLDELCSSAALPRNQRSLAGRVALTRAFRAMTRLESVTIHATSGMAPEDVQGRFDLISLVLGALSGTARLVCSEWTDPSLGPDPYPATAAHPVSTWFLFHSLAGPESTTAVLTGAASGSGLMRAGSECRALAGILRDACTLTRAGGQRNILLNASRINSNHFPPGRPWVSRRSVIRPSSPMYLRRFPPSSASDDSTSRRRCTV